uniref:(northern house mosquito) hypothetical protein n=1 Tax=Culex pipiens TaxID=7175 RepID=A0A8D8DND5_CULPI
MLNAVIVWNDFVGIHQQMAFIPNGTWNRTVRLEVDPVLFRRFRVSQRHDCPSQVGVHQTLRQRNQSPVGVENFFSDHRNKCEVPVLDNSQRVHKFRNVLRIITSIHSAVIDTPDIITAES